MMDPRSMVCRHCLQRIMMRLRKKISPWPDPRAPKSFLVPPAVVSPTSNLNLQRWLVTLRCLAQTSRRLLIVLPRHGFSIRLPAKNWIPALVSSLLNYLLRSLIIDETSCHLRLRIQNTIDQHIARSHTGCVFLVTYNGHPKISLILSTPLTHSALSGNMVLCAGPNVGEPHCWLKVSA